MTSLLSDIQIAERTHVHNQLKRSIKATHKTSESELSLMQHQNLVARSLGYPAWNLLVEDILDCAPGHFSNLVGLCEFKGLIEPSDDVDFDEFWFDGAADS